MQRQVKKNNLGLQEHAELSTENHTSDTESCPLCGRIVPLRYFIKSSKLCRICRGETS